MSHDDSHDVENLKCKLNEAITNMKEIQPVELEKVSEVESVTISGSNIDLLKLCMVKWMKRTFIE